MQSLTLLKKKNLSYIISILAVDTVVVELDLVFLAGVQFVNFGCEEDNSWSVVQ